MPDRAQLPVPHLLMFDLAGRLCALPAPAIGRVLPMATLARPPGLPPLLAGLLLLPDAALPVIRTARLFDLPEAPPTAATALIRLSGAVAALLLVDRVVGLVAQPEEQRLPVAADSTFSGVASAEIDLPDGPCTILDPARILLREEQMRITAFLAEQDRRLERTLGAEDRAWRPSPC